MCVPKNSLTHCSSSELQISLKIQIEFISYNNTIIMIYNDVATVMNYWASKTRSLVLNSTLLQIFRTWCVTHTHEEVAEEGHSEISQSQRLTTDTSSATHSNANYKVHNKASADGNCASGGQQRENDKVAAATRGSTHWSIVSEKVKKSNKKKTLKSCNNGTLIIMIIDTKLQK